MSELYSVKPNKNPLSEPQNPKNPFQVRTERKAFLEAALAAVKAEPPPLTSSADTRSTRAGLIEDELFWINKWLDSNSHLFPDPAA